jgi:hypothetical protein
MAPFVTDNGVEASRLGFPSNDRSTSTTLGPYYLMNSICVMVNRVTSFTQTRRNITGKWEARNSSRMYVHDGNGYFKKDLDGLSGGNLFEAIGDTTHPGSNNYASLSAWLGSSLFDNSKGAAGYGPGAEANSIEGDPLFVGGSAIWTADPRFGVAPGKYRPTASNYKAGAIDLSSSGLNTGWPDSGTYQAWRGALDPNGDGTEIGPRAA